MEDGDMCGSLGCCGGGRAQTDAKSCRLWIMESVDRQTGGGEVVRARKSGIVLV